MTTKILRRDLWIPDELRDWRQWNPKTQLGLTVREALHYLPGELAAELLDRVSRAVVLESSLAIRIWRRCDWCGRHHGPNHKGILYTTCRAFYPTHLIEDYGIVSRKVITDTGVAFLVDAWQNLVELENMKFHGIGTSAVAEGVGNTALTTELTTQYSPDNTRATGTLTEGATANIFKTVGTNTVDAAVTIEEHGVLSQAATGGGVLWDRSLTGTKALANGEGLESTYSITASSGG